MLLKLCGNDTSRGVFHREFRNQLLTTLSVTIITLCHGINLGWLSPTLPKLQNPSETPLNFVVNVEQASWIGSLLSVGAVFGNIVFAQILERVGRKAAIYGMAVPTLILWLTIYFGNSIEYLYVARFFGGATGGGVYVVVPIFISEMADSTIRGRLASLFALSLNTGILLGFIISAHLDYYLVPCIVLVFPVLYLLLAFRYPEPPQDLLRRGRDKEAKESFKFYKNFTSTSKDEIHQFNADFLDLRTAVLEQKSEDGAVGLRDFCNKRSMKALCSGIILMALCIFCGGFAIINYMSSIFAATKSEIHPDTNSIIIGTVQVVGSYAATILVDRYGRKILMIISTAGMGLCLAIFGMYVFYAEDTIADPSSYSLWVPLVLMAFIIFLYNVGLSSVTFVVVVEIMPPKIRSRAVSYSLALLAVFAFISLKIFPIFLDSFGLSATMWFCATVCAFGLFYIPVFLQETKGKSMEKDDSVQ